MQNKIVLRNIFMSKKISKCQKNLMHEMEWWDEWMWWMGEFYTNKIKCAFKYILNLVLIYTTCIR